MLRPPSAEAVLSNHERRLWDLERQRPIANDLRKLRKGVDDGGGEGCCCFHLIGWSCDGGLTPYQATGFVYLGYEFGTDNIEVETIEIVTPAAISGLTFTLDGNDFIVDDEESGWIKFVLADMDIEINGTMGDRWAFSFNVTSEEETPDLSTYHGIVQINGTGICGYQTVSLYGGT